MYARPDTHNTTTGGGSGIRSIYIVGGDARGGLAPALVRITTLQILQTLPPLNLSSHISHHKLKSPSFRVLPVGDKLCFYWCCAAV